jgi:hypothetical protein
MSHRAGPGDAFVRIPVKVTTVPLIAHVLVETYVGAVAGSVRSPQGDLAVGGVDDRRARRSLAGKQGLVTSPASRHADAT